MIVEAQCIEELTELAGHALLESRCKCRWLRACLGSIKEPTLC